MKLKVLACVLLSVVALVAPVSQAANLREEIVRKSVSVKSPPRDTSVISHFNPAVHVYEAEGSVVIDKEIPPPPPQNLAKKVSIQSPVITSSENSHFDPAAHRYEAEGEVLINRDSSLLKKQHPIFESFQRPRNTVVSSVVSKPRYTGLNLKKSVSVKSPERVYSVINHFNPAGHVYAATGDVNINRAPSVRQNTYATPIVSVTKPKVTFKQKSVSSDSNEYETKQVSPVKVKSVFTPYRASSGLTLQKSVSVKSPQRQTSVINHFNPAGHTYAATGNVVINRASSASNRVSKKGSTVRTQYQPSVDSSKSTSFVSQRVQTKSPKVSGLSLQKSVSVKSPKRRTNVINHFDPAGHVYAATGDVVINRSPSKPLVQTIRQNNYVTPTVKVTKPRVTYHQRDIDSDEDEDQRVRVSPVQVNTFVTPKRFSSGLSLQKSVSVKYPERESTVINHFTPAGHRYEATGNVVINRASTASNGVSKTSRPQAVIRKVSKIRTNSQPASAYKSIDRTKTTFTSQRVQTKSPQHSGLSLQKTVSVKSPERVTSIINHFDPAGHVYAATGDVNINRTPSKLGQNTYASPIVRVTKPKVTFKQVQASSDSAEYDNKQVSPVRVKSVFAPNRASSGLTLQKSVSVKSPQRQTSVINHFNPAGHIYSATGNVVINRVSSASTRGSEKVSTVRTQSRPSIVSKHVDSSKSASFVSQRVQTKSPKVSGLSLQKSVSVKSPERVYNVINHFDPAGHVYAATGNVVINRSPSKPLVHTIRQNNYVAPTVKVTKPRVTYQQRDIDSDEDELQRVRVSPVQVNTFVTPKRVSSGLSLHKSVSVRYPERKSTVINHFTPADHRYEATGNVVINRASKTSSGGSKTSQPQAVIRKVTNVRTKYQPQTTYKPDVRTKSYTSQRVQTIIPQSAGLSLQKSVSVKSPERVYSTINHFDPAGHVYAARGDVNINRTPLKVRQNTYVAPTFQVTKPKLTNQRLDDSDEVSFVSAPKRVYTAQVSSVPATKKVSSVRVSSVPTSKKVQNTFSLEKEVTVKSPHRVSTVINHFTPAQHVYAATGNVKINRGGSSITRTPSVLKVQQGTAKLHATKVETGSTKLAAPKVPVVKTIAPKPKVPVVKTIAPKPKVSIVKTIAPKPKVPVVKTIAPKQPSVSVVTRKFKMPLQSFVIPTPSNVGVQAVSVPKVSLPAVQNIYVAPEESPEEEVNFDFGAAPAYDFLSQFSGINSYLPPKADPTAAPTRAPTSAPVYRPAPVREIKPVAKPSAGAGSGGLFSLHKTVSVTSPENKSSVINHFNPAGHVYKATGQVSINRSL